jgi:hypothetical protein
MDTDFIKSIDNEWTRDTTLIKANNIGCERVNKCIYDTELIYIESNNHTYVDYVRWIKRMDMWVGKLHWKYDINVNVISMNTYYIFYDCCAHNNLIMCKMLYKMYPSLNVSIFDNRIFKVSCQNGYLELCQWLYDIGTIAISEQMISLACYSNNILLAKWLRSFITIKFEKSYDNLFEQNLYTNRLEMAQYIYNTFPLTFTNIYMIFTHCCCKNHLKMCQWLITICPNIDITYNDNHIFKYCCKNNVINISLWLCEIIPEYSLGYNGDRIYSIIAIKIIKKDILIIDDCCVCLEDSDTMLPCNHVICLNCCNALFEQICPLCRVKFNFCFVKI